MRQNPLIARLGNGAVLWLSFGVNGLHDRLHPSQTHSLIRSPIGRGFWLRLRCRPSRAGRARTNGRGANARNHYRCAVNATYATL